MRFDSYLCENNSDGLPHQGLAARQCVLLALGLRVITNLDFINWSEASGYISKLFGSAMRHVVMAVVAL